MSRKYRQHLLTLAKRMRRNPTRGEMVLWDHLKNKQLRGLKFYRQYPVKNFIIDFYCKRLALAIEVDGSIHNLPEQKLRDEARQVELEDLGITFLRFSEKEAVEATHQVLEKISTQIDTMTNP